METCVEDETETAVADAAATEAAKRLDFFILEGEEGGVWLPRKMTMDFRRKIGGREKERENFW